MKAWSMIGTEAYIVNEDGLEKDLAERRAKAAARFAKKKEAGK